MEIIDIKYPFDLSYCMQLSYISTLIPIKNQQARRKGTGAGVTMIYPLTILSQDFSESQPQQPQQQSNEINRTYDYINKKINSAKWNPIDEYNKDKDKSLPLTLDISVRKQLNRMNENYDNWVKRKNYNLLCTGCLREEYTPCRGRQYNSDELHYI